MRALVHSIITSDPTLLSMIPEERWISGGAVDAPPLRPFGVIRIVDDLASVVGSSHPRVEIWVHDSRGSYLQIDAIIRRLTAVLESTPEVQDETSRIVAIEWTGNSPDLVDEGYNTNCRNSGYTLTGRK